MQSGKSFLERNLKGLLISSSILLLAFEFSVVCKISVIFEIPIVVFEKFILKMSITKGSVPHLIALQIYALISAKASKTKDKFIINIYSLCVFSLNFFLSHALFVCVYFYSILFFPILFYSILYTKIAYIFCIQLHLNWKVAYIFRVQLHLNLKVAYIFRVQTMKLHTFLGAKTHRFDCK